MLKDIKRFYAKVRKTPSCWDWTACKDKDGYGFFKLNGKQEKAHRVAYVLKHGSIPVGTLICHTCDNPSCVNPDHLFAGSQQENLHDMVIKGRSTSTEKNPASKLTSNDVAEIRFKFDSGKSQTVLSKEYNVSQAQISRIVTNRAWWGV